MIAQTFSKWGVPVLFRYNTFPEITGYPEVTTAINRRVDLETLSNFINSTVQANVIIPDEELERYVRELADFPAPAVQVGEETVTPAEDEPSEEQVGPPTDEGQKAESGRAKASLEGQGVVTFARGGLKRYHAATDAYKAELRSDYDTWMEEVERGIKAHDPDGDRRSLWEKWETWVALGLLAMKRKGWQRIPEAFALGYHSAAFSPAARAALEAEITDNDRYLSENLWPKIGKSLTGHDLQEIGRLYWAGETEEARTLLWGRLGAARGNVGQYSGAFWHAIWIGSLARLEDEAEPVPGEELEGYEPTPITWNLDAIAKHCGTCLMFGNRTYDSMDDLLATTGGVLPGQGTECDGNCRCWLTAMSGDSWSLL